MLGIIDIKIPCCETKSIIFFLHAVLCKQRCQRHHEWCSSLWQKFVKKGPIFPTFFPNKRRWEWDCSIPSWAQHCFKKFFLALKNRTFQVKLKKHKTLEELSKSQHDQGCTIKKVKLNEENTDFLLTDFTTFTKIVNKAGYYNSFFLFLFQHFKTQLSRVNETTTNQQDVVLKISRREIDYHTFNCWCNFQCWLFSL